MRQDRPYSNIPGTYVLDPQHSMQGYELNMFCMSLNKPENRDKFRLNEEAYLNDFPLTKEQREAFYPGIGWVYCSSVAISITPLS